MGTRKRKIVFLGEASGEEIYRHLRANFLDNVKSLAPHKPMGFHGLLTGIAEPYTLWYNIIGNL
jgi:hypothetical protein